MIAHFSEACFSPQQPRSHTSADHVILFVSPLDVTGRLSPIAQHILDQVGAQKCDVERRGNIEPIEGQQALLALPQNQSRRRDAFANDIEQCMESLLTGLGSLRLAQHLEMQIQIRPARSAQLVAKVGLGMHQALLLQCLRPHTFYRRFDSLAAVAQH